MLKKKYRLLGQGSGIKSKTEDALFTLRTTENNRLNSRFGFIVSKSIDKRAVVRNRIKRVFRALIEDRLEEIKPGKDLSFAIKKKAKNIDREAFSRSINTVLEKEKLLNENNRN